MNNKYEIVYADPPWGYNDKSKHRGGAVRYYDTMSVEDIMNFPVKDIIANNAILFLWVTFPFLQAGLNTIEAWGFKYKTIGFNWIKFNKKTPSLFWGMGHWTRSNSELCLLGIRGKPKRICKSVHSVIIDKVKKHSQKPDAVRKRIVELMGDLPRVELFARDQSDGWDVYGNEIKSTIKINGFENSGNI